MLMNHHPSPPPTIHTADSKQQEGPAVLSCDSVFLGVRADLSGQGVRADLSGQDACLCVSTDTMPSYYLQGLSSWPVPTMRTGTI